MKYRANRAYTLYIVEFLEVATGVYYLKCINVMIKVRGELLQYYNEI